MFFGKTLPKNGRDAFLLIRSHETAHKCREMLKTGLGKQGTVSFQKSLNGLAHRAVSTSRTAAPFLKETLSSVDLFHACRSFRGGVGSPTSATTTSDTTGFLFTKNSQLCLKSAKL